VRQRESERGVRLRESAQARARKRRYDAGADVTYVTRHTASEIKGERASARERASERVRESASESARESARERGRPMPAPKRVAAATAMEVSRTASLKVVSSSIVRAAAASGLSRFLAGTWKG